MSTRTDLPLALLSAVGLLAATTGTFLEVAPNRLLSGSALALWHVPPAMGGWVVLALWCWGLACSLLATKRGLSIACALLVGLPLLAGAGAHRLLADAAVHTTRIQLGAGFWIMWLAAALLLLDRLRGARRVVQLAIWTGVVVAFVVAGWSGAFADLALVREYAAQRDVFATALRIHLLLTLGTLGLALAIGLPLGWIAWRRRRAGNGILGVLSLVQTVPSIALFALLIGPLAWLAQHMPSLQALGFGGTGAAPAVIALCLYALLPVVRYTLAGLDGVPRDAVEAARGMGMTRWQVLARVQWPLAWPVLLAGLRIVSVQAIGMVAVAALIGAGGLGRFVFLGVGQGAIDMVLLGTLAIIALALLADLVFQAALMLTERRG
ncbi:osmoprotectant transport system permease protein [Luteibacter rhizovicinus]|uniref:Osmoprotectant transport system permease protein n=1 Tax=Luteibacter rhizovicinus TaxID=242606 RepID=A0A4R3YMG4_9GAMM|nr:ABC transporter permease [Luteibacter rhizovicinus]TCV93817.1 osmoprotectant transport system permease protein [Luteibacter rhizovicinus]